MSDTDSIKEMLIDFELENDEFSLCSHLLPELSQLSQRPQTQSIEMAVSKPQSSESRKVASSPNVARDQVLHSIIKSMNENPAANADACWDELWEEILTDQEFSLKEENLLLKCAMMRMLELSDQVLHEEDNESSSVVSSRATTSSNSSIPYASASQNCTCKKSDGQANNMANKVTVSGSYDDDDVKGQLKRRAAIAATKCKPDSQGLSDILGLEEAKLTIYEALLMPTQYPQLFKGLRKAPSTILFYGPPGTGKTRLAHAAAAEISADFYCISSSDLLSVWLGESEKLIKEMFNMQQGDRKVIIFVDEVDSLCRVRSSDEAEHSRRLKTELLVQLDAAPMKGIVVICATNCPWDLDKAFLRRYHRKIYIGTPDRNARCQLLSKYECMMDTAKPIDWTEILDKTELYTGADMEQVAQYALMLPVRELRTSTNFWRFNDDGLLLPTNSEDPLAIEGTLDGVPRHLVNARQVELCDFAAALDAVFPTVSKMDIQKYQDFARQCGQFG
ncbi:uncharacterized protein LOC132197070 [Neocloeon triangulifer]|uniref:uncharacterized protein LOC132197070 n=1 Tax=Neocloeon triangulifer TaxID=2078957 RepID=UPI00286F4BED|nr:uncharacterized protein LOC132197070 [Neocloeon triangulifer]